MSDRYLGGFIKAVQTPPTVSAAPGIWTLDQASRYIKAGLWPQSSDPNFNQTVLLLHGDGTNGAQNNTFLDSSTNNFTITRNGNTTQGTFSPFSADEGKWSNYFPGTAGFMLPNNSAFAMSGDFTYEAWVYLDTVGQSQGIITPIDSGADPWSGCVFFVDGVTNKLRVTMYGSGQPDLYHQTIMVANRWYHVALSRSGSTIRLYLDGVVSSTTATTSFSFTQSGLTVGSQYSSIAPLVGYLSNVRIVKGRAVYTSSFTPPSDPLGATSGGEDPPQGTETSLLTCQSNRFVDNSTNDFTITYNASNAQYVNAFSPFLPTAAYSASVNGGSGYFNGSGNLLSIPSAVSTFQGLGANNFSYECFVYPLRQTNTFSQGLITYGQAGSTGTSTCDLVINASGYLQLAYATGAAPSLLSPSLIPVNAWTHVAVCRSGSTLSMFVNGTRVSTASTSATVGASGDVVYIGNQWYAIATTRQLQGYISNARVLIGSSAYDATQTTITVPTSPPTAVTNTVLLTNFTNAGIFDNTAKNDLETVGNAQVDTSVVKYGTGSMKFDGSGDYLFQPNGVNQNFAFGTGNFTIECWLYLNTVSGDQVITDFRAVNDARTTAFSFSTTGTALKVYINGNRSLGGTLAINTWYHIALVRNGTGSNNLTAYINGTATGTTATLTENLTDTSIQIGAVAGGGVAQLNGFIDDLRITKGVARYTTTFTPPGGPFPNQ